MNRKIEYIVNKMNNRGIDALILFKPQHTYYFSGFNPIIQSHPCAVIISAGGDVSLIVHSVRYRHAQEDSAIKNITLYGQWGEYGANAPETLLEAVNNIISKQKKSEKTVLGLELSYISYSYYSALKTNFPEAKFVDIEDIILKEREIKNENEIKYIRIAADITNYGMKAAVSAIERRESEAEISVAAMIAMNERWKNNYPDLEPVDFASDEGGIFNSLWAYCLAGDRMNHMCDSSSSYKVKEGDLVMVVIWAAINGYHAENERTVAVGDMNSQQMNAYNTVLRARESGAKILKSGSKFSDVYNSAVAEMKDDYSTRLPGRVGHGLGLGPHEEPSIAKNNDNLLKKNMVLTFEPSLRIGKYGGVQHSDSVLIKEDGFEFLTDFDRGFLQV